MPVSALGTAATKPVGGYNRIYALLSVQVEWCAVLFCIYLIDSFHSDWLSIVPGHKFEKKMTFKENNIFFVENCLFSPPRITIKYSILYMCIHIATKFVIF